MITATEVKCVTCNDTYELDSGDGCPDCCDHSDRDCYCCLICGADLTESTMSRAYDRAKDLRQDGY